ncbi:hypothetical protein MTX78_08340 [Hymenobacter tibetensis]|uniref:STAS/SEC14 domain-containing protein n=1 Tax=Hymenobacter tibetensis TaxID=497967 RepID=A0ABY4D2N0_9BACT|nr:hypothetical protein [Hymenobacter tibetensis]UOG76597.1 hypothetical protein MTX78_08340 [Hymenobacter tibetensis]
MDAFSTAYLDVTYDEEIQVLIGRWKRGVMPFELQQGYAAILDIAAEKDCRFWLLDIRRRTGVDASDVFWMMEDFFPRLHPRLGSTTYMALLMAPHHLAGALSNIGLASNNAPQGQPYLIQRFTEEAPALAWLERCLQQGSVER